jgi:hypothetical protein
MQYIMCMMAAFALVFVGSFAHAHIVYSDLGVVSSSRPEVSRIGPMSRRGWWLGTDQSLGDSHSVANARAFYKFALAEAATVRISVLASDPIGNPALSVYAGVLPDRAHDDTLRDPLIGFTLFRNGALLYEASPTDARPDDPLIRRYIPAGYDANGEPLVDPATGFVRLVENPAWTVPDPNLGGLTPAEWYAANYMPHNGYRDTLNFTVQGGLRLDPTSGWVPNNFSPSGPSSGFWGQFDAFGDWSMANDDDEWSGLRYISSVSATPCDGSNCLFTTTGGFFNPGHVVGNNGPLEVLLLRLQAGTYTIVADGEGCGVAGCQTRTLAATVSVSVVPLPAAAWLFGSGLAGLAGFARRTMTSRV